MTKTTSHFSQIPKATISSSNTKKNYSVDRVPRYLPPSNFHQPWIPLRFSHGHSLPFSTPTKPSPKPQPCHRQTHFSNRSQTHSFHHFQEALSPQNHFAFHHFLDPSIPTCPFFGWTFTASEIGSFRHCKHEVLVPVLWRWVRHSGATTVWGHHGAWGTFISHLFNILVHISARKSWRGFMFFNVIEFMHL